jgi:hypothetical protein
MKATSFLSGVLLLVLFSSCYTPRYVYNPHAQNVPSFTKKGDSKLAAYYSTNLSDGSGDEDGQTKSTKKSSGYDLQLAYAITGKFALAAAVSQKNEKNINGDLNIDETVIRYKRNFTEFAAGYFIPLDVKHDIYFQVFAGGGFGKLHFIDQQVSKVNYYDSRITRFFIQPAFMLRSGEIFSVALSLKTSILKFNNIVTDYDPAELESYNLDGLTGNNILMFEPLVVIGGGLRKLPGLKLEIQIGAAKILHYRQSDRKPSIRSGNFSAGLVFDLPKLLQKK